MRWGRTYPLEGIPLSAHREILEEAARLGYPDAWTAEVNANDAFTPMAAMACWTKNTRLGSAIGNIYTRTPTLLAQTAAGLAHLAPGPHLRRRPAGEDAGARRRARGRRDHELHFAR